MTSTKVPKIPIWLPNWEDESAYPDPKRTVSKEQWAWEFIRRNPRYQRLYREGLRHKETWYKKHQNNKLFYKYFNCIPKVNKGESYEEYSARCESEKKDPIIKPKKRRILDEFPVTKFSSKLNPAKTDHPELCTNYNYPLMFTALNLDKDFSYKVRGDDEVFFVFSSLLPIADQINKAKESLTEEQEEFVKEGVSLSHKGRVQVNVLRNYLRYLDANINGVKQVAMARVIHQHDDKTSATQKISTGLLKAKYYRDEGFLKILKTQILE